MTAFSEDGYVIDQRHIGDYLYGRYNSSHNGCGWIAIYNLFKGLGRTDSLESVYKGMKAILPFEGRLGTPIFTMFLFMRKKGLKTKKVFGRKRLCKAAEKAEGGIVMYKDEDWLHYVAFIKSEGGKFRFFNAREGDPAHISTMDEFIKESTNIPFAIGMLVV